MKSIVKLVLVVSLFSSVVFADGEMGTGGKTCTGPCLTATQPNEKEITTIESTDSALSFVQEYLQSVFKYFED